MKKLILSLFLLSGLAAFAQDATVSVVLTGQRTNRSIYIGTNTTATVVLNQFASTAGFSTGASNLASIVTNTLVPSTAATTVGVVIGGFSASLATNDWYFQRAYRREGPYEAWTNVTFIVPSGTQAYSNYSFAIGDYCYFKISDATNRLNIVNSNYLSFHQKAR